MLLPGFLFARAERLARAHDVVGLLALFDDQREMGWQRAIAADAFVELRAELVEDEESQVREAAVTALAALGPAGRPLIERVARSDRYRWVREAARDALLERRA